jgi:hypothetical protein
MAFKTQEQIAKMRELETPYTIDDVNHFRDQKIERAVVDITLESQRAFPHQAATSHQATVERNGNTKEILVVFTGERMLDFYRSKLLNSMKAERQDNLNSGNHDLEQITRRVIIEGFWKKVTWRDRNGTAHEYWNLWAAKWHFQDADGKFHEEGQLPDFSLFEVAAA